MREPIPALKSRTSSLGFLLRNTEEARRLLPEESQPGTLPTPQLEGTPTPAPTVLSCSAETSNALLLTPTDTGPARHRSPQVPTPTAPHPLSPHFPQTATDTRGSTHVRSRAAPPLLLSATGPWLWAGLWAGLWRGWGGAGACRQTPSPVATDSAPPPWPGSPGVLPAASWVFLTYTHTPQSAPERSSPVRAGIRKEI